MEKHLAVSLNIGDIVTRAYAMRTLIFGRVAGFRFEEGYGEDMLIQWEDGTTSYELWCEVYSQEDYEEMADSRYDPEYIRDKIEAAFGPIN